MNFFPKQFSVNKIKNKNYLSYYGLLLFIALFAIIGVKLLIGSHAAGPFVSVNSSSGSLANGATVQSSSSVSGGQYVKFSSTSLTGHTYWNGDYENGTSSICYNGSNSNCGSNNTQYDSYSCPGQPQVVTSATDGNGNTILPRSGKYFASYYVDDNSNSSHCPNTFTTIGNRTSMRGYPQNMLCNAGDSCVAGNDAYFGFSVYIPTNFGVSPANSTAPYPPSWLTLVGVYGNPTGGAGPQTIHMEGVPNYCHITACTASNGNAQLAMQTQSSDPWGIAMDKIRGQWQDITLHIHMSPNGPGSCVQAPCTDIGSISIWLNGTAVLTNYQKATLIQGNNWTGPGGTNWLQFNQYRDINYNMGPQTLYYDEAKLASTYACAQPGVTCP